MTDNRTCGKKRTKLLHLTAERQLTEKYGINNQEKVCHELLETADDQSERRDRGTFQLRA